MPPWPTTRDDARTESGPGHSNLIRPAPGTGLGYRRHRAPTGALDGVRKDQAVAGTGQRRRRGIARLLALCAVLLGLFLMHGAPATAAEGCHGAMSAAPMSAGHDKAVMASAARASVTPASSPVMTQADAQQASGASEMDGATCVSTPARDRIPLPPGGLLAVVAVLAASFLAVRPPALGRTGRRGPPPPGGRSLLLTVCIART